MDMTISMLWFTFHAFCGATLSHFEGIIYPPAVIRDQDIDLRIDFSVLSPHPLPLLQLHFHLRL